MPQSITDIKFEHGHDANRLADSVAQLRDLLDEKDASLASAQSKVKESLDAWGSVRDELRLREAEILARGKVIADQTAEIENYANRAVEMKELLAALQHKYTALSEKHSTTLELSLDAERRHLAYVEQMVAYKEDADRRIRKLEASVSHMNFLVAENTSLAMAIYNRVIWRKIATPATAKVRRILTRLNLYNPAPSAS